jgi:hypothetical protein
MEPITLVSLALRLPLASLASVFNLNERMKQISLIPLPNSAIVPGLWRTSDIAAVMMIHEGMGGSAALVLPRPFLSLFSYDPEFSLSPFFFFPFQFTSIFSKAKRGISARRPFPFSQPFSRMHKGAMYMPPRTYLPRLSGSSAGYSNSDENDNAYSAMWSPLH